MENVQESTVVVNINDPVELASTSVRSYLRKPFKQTVKITTTSLKPKDWILFAYFLASTPLLFIGLDSAADVPWFGVVLRLVVTPAILFARYYFAVVPDSLHKRRLLFRIWKGRGVQVIIPYIFGMLFDIIHILCGVYFYGEDGKIIANMWNYPLDFWDDHFKQIDSDITGVSIDQGVGYAWRGVTGHGSTANKIIGEYLNLCYFLFYLVIFLTYAVPYVIRPRLNFEVITTGMCTAYLVCLFLFPLLPTAGPYWQYPDQRPPPEEVGYFFSYIAQYLVQGGSSIGTAFPSSHCAVTTVSFVLSLVYCLPLGIAYIFVCPAIVVATVWLGYHYVIDSIPGVGIGLAISALTILIVPRWLKHVREPLTGDPCYLTAMVTFPVVERAGDAELAGQSEADVQQAESVSSLHEGQKLEDKPDTEADGKATA